MLRVEVVLIRVLEVVFFSGLSGCAVTVVLSWISIIGADLTKEREPGAGDPIELSRSNWSDFFHLELKRQEGLRDGFQQ